MHLPDAYALAEQLLAEHGLSDWQVTFDNAKRRAGVCRYATRTIGLSAPLTALHGPEDVRDTILHEVAHALTGPRHGHDAHWQRVARSIGCSGQRCVSQEAPTVETPWLGVCPAGHTRGLHRRPERVATCGRCSSSFDLAHVFTWTKHGRPAQMHPNYLAEVEQLASGRRLAILPVGARGRVTVAGEHHGLVGKIIKRGRTSYHLRAGRQVLRVPFAWVEPMA